MVWCAAYLVLPVEKKINRDKFALDERNPFRKILVRSIYLMPKNDVKPSDWFKHFRLFSTIIYGP